MAIGERSWELLVLLTLSCAAVLMMFVGVTSWSDLNQPIQISSQPQGSVVEVQPWIYNDVAVPEVRDVQDIGVLLKVRSYVDGFIGSQLGNPLGLWSGEESRAVQELEDENGVVANVKSFFAGVGDSIKRWGQKTISPPAILHATEPLGRFPHSDMPPTSTLASKLTAIVGKVMEAYYADSVVAEDTKTCSGILEEQTKKLVKNLKYELKEKLCNDELRSVNEEKFCNFYKSHPKMATLMVFTDLEVDPVGVALMRTTTSELCSSSNANLVHSVHKMEKLARRLRVSSREIGQNGFAVHEHGEHDRLQAAQFDVEEGPSCEDCYLEGIHNIMRGIKARLSSNCQAPTPCMAETCAFVKEHRYLTRTYLLLKIRPWEIVSMRCVLSCRSSPGFLFPFGIPHYPETAMSQPLAPNLPRLRDEFIRGLDIDHPRLAMIDPSMPVSHPAEIDNFILRRTSRCRKPGRLQAFRRAMQLRGKFLRRSDNDGADGLEGNGQAHLVVVVNGHPLGPVNIRDIFADFHNPIVVSPFHDLNVRQSVVLKSFFENFHTISGWKDTQSKSDQIYLEGRAEHPVLDSFVEENSNVESLDQVSDKPVQERGTEEQVVPSAVEGSDGASMMDMVFESAEKFTNSSEDSSDEVSRAAI